MPRPLSMSTSYGSRQPLVDHGSPESAAGTNRRRQLGFMKYGVIEKKQRNPHQSREHARQLVQAFSSHDQSFDLQQSFSNTPSLLKQPSISASFAADFGSAFGDMVNNDSSSSSSADEADFFANTKSASGGAANATSSERGNNPHLFERDPFASSHSTSSSQKKAKSNATGKTGTLPTPPAPVIRSIQEERRRLKQKSNNAGAFTPTSKSPGRLSASATTAKRTNGSRNATAASMSDWPDAATQGMVANFDEITPSAKHAKTTKPGFTTFPSNSSMQSDFAAQTNHSYSSSTSTRLAGTNAHRQSDPPAIAASFSSASSVGSSSNVGVAARRRMRQQLKLQSNQPQPLPGSPQHPYGRTVRNVAASDSSIGSSSRGGTYGKSTDHVANYQQRSGSAGGASSQYYMQQQQALNSSGYSTASAKSALNASANYSANRSVGGSSHGAFSDSVGTATSATDVNLFDPTNTHGFTFDAFGLDASEMDREVDQAMQDLAESSHPDFSLFLDGDPEADSDWKWEDPSNFSRESSPVMMGSDGNNNHSNADHKRNNSEDEFVDGFRITKSPKSLSLPQQPVMIVRHSPTRSEKSSLSSDSLHNATPSDGIAVNPFKVQAGFLSSANPRKVVVRPREQNLYPPATQQPRYAARTGRDNKNSSQQESDPDRESGDVNDHGPEDDLRRPQHHSARLPAVDAPRGGNSGSDALDATSEYNSDFEHRIQSDDRGVGPPSDTGTSSSYQIASDIVVTSDFTVSDVLRQTNNRYNPNNDLIDFEVRKGKKNTLDSNFDESQRIRNPEESDTAQTESTSATTKPPDDEKKDNIDEHYENVEDDNVVAKPAVNALRSKWEKMANGTSTKNENDDKKIMPKALSVADIENLQAKLGSELWSPEKIEKLVSASSSVSDHNHDEGAGKMHQHGNHEEDLSSESLNIVQKRPATVKTQQQQNIQQLSDEKRHSEQLDPKRRWNSSKDGQTSYTSKNDANYDQDREEKKDEISDAPIFFTQRSGHQATVRSDDGQAVQGSQRNDNDGKGAEMERTSFAAVRDRFKSTTTESHQASIVSKSEGVIDVRYAAVNAVMSSISPKISSPADSRSEAGGITTSVSRTTASALYNSTTHRDGQPAPLSPNKHLRGTADNKVITPKRSANDKSNPQKFSSQAMRMAMREHEARRKTSPTISNTPLGHASMPKQSFGSSDLCDSLTTSTATSPRISPRKAAVAAVQSEHERFARSHWSHPHDSTGEAVNRDAQRMTTMDSEYPSVVSDPKRDVDKRDTTNEEVNIQPEKKLSYRERRELEIQKQRELTMGQSESSSVGESSTLDVATLIKRRIAANKNKAPVPQRSAPPAETEDVVSFRSKLRPVVRPESSAPSSTEDATNRQYDDSMLSSHERREETPGSSSYDNTGGVSPSHQPKSLNHHRYVQKPASVEEGPSTYRNARHDHQRANDEQQMQQHHPQQYVRQHSPRHVQQRHDQFPQEPTTYPSTRLDHQKVHDEQQLQQHHPQQYERQHSPRHVQQQHDQFHQEHQRREKTELREPSIIHDFPLREVEDEVSPPVVQERIYSSSSSAIQPMSSPRIFQRREEEETSVHMQRQVVSEIGDSDGHDNYRSAPRSIISNRQGARYTASPRSESQRSPSRQSDLVIQVEHSAENDAEDKKQPSPAISHLLMLQQLQQKRQDDSSKSPKSLSMIPSEQEDRDKITQKGTTPKATMMMLNAFLAGRESISSADGGAAAGGKSKSSDVSEADTRENASSPSPGIPPALNGDPAYAKYFKMLSLGMPMEVVKHAMLRDGMDSSVMDGDHNKPAGIPLKDDPDYAKYFRMLNIGLPMEAVKHAMARDGHDPSVMDQDHNLPAASASSKKDEKPTKEEDSHRRARLHWKTLRKVTSNSLWAQIDQDIALENIEIDEEEFQELFQEEKRAVPKSATKANYSTKRGATVCVIDSKRANNGGIILARLKMSHDDLADAVDRIDERPLSAEQIENIIEYLPTKDERRALESYMLEGGQDAAEKFDCLCECEKFMVSMMTVKHAKRKVSALLFKLQFETCLHDIQKEADLIEQACHELSSSARLRQLLGIVLTFGNRLNTAGNGKRKAGAFTLDSLLKLNQAKAFDKKTTFLHYIVLIVRRNNEELLNFKEDLPTVFATEKVFWDQCVADLDEVENQLENLRKIALYQAHQHQVYRLRQKKKSTHEQDESFSDSEIVLSLEEEVEALRSTPIGLFTLNAIRLVSALRDKVESTNRKYNHLLEYFGEEDNRKQPHELFSIITSFSREFEKAKDEVNNNEKKKLREERKRLQSSQPNGSRKPPSSSPQRSAQRSPQRSAQRSPQRSAQRSPQRSAQRSPQRSPQRSGSSMLRASNFQPHLGHVLKELKMKAPMTSVQQARVQSNSIVLSNESDENEQLRMFQTNYEMHENRQDVHVENEDVNNAQQFLGRIREEDEYNEVSGLSSDVHDHRAVVDQIDASVPRDGIRISPASSPRNHFGSTNTSCYETQNEGKTDRETTFQHEKLPTVLSTPCGNEERQVSPRTPIRHVDEIITHSEAPAVDAPISTSVISMASIRSKTRLRRQRFVGAALPPKSLSSMPGSSDDSTLANNIPLTKRPASPPPPSSDGADTNAHPSSRFMPPSKTPSAPRSLAPVFNPPPRSPSRMNPTASITPRSSESTQANQTRDVASPAAAVFSSAASRAAIRHKRRLLDQQQRMKTANAPTNLSSGAGQE